MTLAYGPDIERQKDQEASFELKANHVLIMAFLTLIQKYSTISFDDIKIFIIIFSSNVKAKTVCINLINIFN